MIRKSINKKNNWYNQFNKQIHMNITNITNTLYLSILFSLVQFSVVGGLNHTFDL